MGVRGGCGAIEEVKTETLIVSKSAMVSNEKWGF